LAESSPPTLIDPVRSKATRSLIVNLSELLPHLAGFPGAGSENAGSSRSVLSPLVHVMVLPDAVPPPPVFPSHPPRVKVLIVRFPVNDVQTTDLLVAAADPAERRTAVKADATRIDAAANARKKRRPCTSSPPPTSHHPFVRPNGDLPRILQGSPQVDGAEATRTAR